jgi:hypothetical protein
MKLSQTQQIFSLNVSKLIQYAAGLGYGLTFGEAHRPDFVQEIYYEKGLSKVKKGGQHSKRLAVDFFLFINGKYTDRKDDYKPLADYWEQLNPKNRAGYYFESIVDPYHFEMLEK